MRWLQDGDRNTKFFHACVRGRKRKLQVTEIATDQGAVINQEDVMGSEAVTFYSKQFQAEEHSVIIQ